MKKIKSAVVNVGRLSCSSHPLRNLPRGKVVEGDELQLLLDHGCTVTEDRKNKKAHLLVLEHEEAPKKAMPKKAKPKSKLKPKAKQEVVEEKEDKPTVDKAE